MNPKQFAADLAGKIEKVPLESLHEDPANARKHGEHNLQTILGSLKEFGYVEPIIVQKSSGKVIGGNGRLAVLRKMGVKTVDAVMLDINDQKATALGIALNRSAELAEWNMDALQASLDSLKSSGFEISTIGFDEIPGMGKPEEEKQRVSEGPQEFIVIVNCTDEQQQQEIFERLSQEGLLCKVMS